MQPCKHPVILQVHIGLLTNLGKKLNEVCTEYDLDGKNIHRYLRREINSPKAIAERDFVLKMAKVNLGDCDSVNNHD